MIGPGTHRKKSIPAIKAIYDLYGKGDQLETIQIDAPHNYNRESREAVYRFMGKHVLDDPNAASYKEQSIRQEKLQDMMVFAGRALPDNAVNLEQLVEWWIKAAKKQNDSTRDPEQFRERLTLALGAEWPERVEDRITGERIVLSRPGKGDQIPGIWIPGKGRLCWWFIPAARLQLSRLLPLPKQSRRAGRFC